MESGTTITALLTPPAPGAIAVIGLAGPDTRSILAQVIQRPGKDSIEMLPDNTPFFCRVVDDGTIVDDAVVVLTHNACETIAEIDTHGGVRIAQRTLQLLERCGAQVVSGWDYLARTTSALPVERDVDRALLGTNGRRLVQWLLSQRQILPDYLARMDALSPGEVAAFRQRSETAIRLIHGIHVAIIGPSNAGKSTLANRLIGKDRVITCDEAGTTRDWVSETALIRGWPITLTDTAGIRDTDCAIESEAIRRSHQQATAADLCLIVLDASSGMAECEAQFDAIQALVPQNRPAMVIMNKRDRTPMGRLLTTGNAAEPPDRLSNACHISALHGQGIDDLEQRIEQRLSLDLLEDALPTAFLPRHLVPTV